MISQGKKAIVFLSIACCVSNLFGIKGETKTFPYLAGSQCASDMVINLVELAQLRIKEPLSIEEFLERYSYSFYTYNEWELFLKGFYQQFKMTDIQEAAYQARADKYLRRLLVRGHQIFMELLPMIIKRGSNWFEDECEFTEFFRKALLRAADEKYGIGSKLYNDVDYLVRSLWV